MIKSFKMHRNCQEPNLKGPNFEQPVRPWNKYGQRNCQRYCYVSQSKLSTGWANSKDKAQGVAGPMGRSQPLRGHFNGTVAPRGPRPSPPREPPSKCKNLTITRDKTYTPKVGPDTLPACIADTRYWVPDIQTELAM